MAIESVGLQIPISVDVSNIAKSISDAIKLGTSGAHGVSGGTTIPAPKVDLSGYSSQMNRIERMSAEAVEGAQEHFDKMENNFKSMLDRIDKLIERRSNRGGNKNPAAGIVGTPQTIDNDTKRITRQIEKSSDDILAALTSAREKRDRLESLTSRAHASLKQHGYVSQDIFDDPEGDKAAKRAVSLVSRRESADERLRQQSQRREAANQRKANAAALAEFKQSQMEYEREVLRISEESSKRIFLGRTGARASSGHDELSQMSKMALRNNEFERRTQAMVERLQSADPETHKYLEKLPDVERYRSAANVRINAMKRANADAERELARIQKEHEERMLEIIEQQEEAAKQHALSRVGARDPHEDNMLSPRAKTKLREAEKERRTVLMMERIESKDTLHPFLDALPNAAEYRRAATARLESMRRETEKTTHELKRITDRYYEQLEKATGMRRDGSTGPNKGKLGYAAQRRRILEGPDAGKWIETLPAIETTAGRHAEALRKRIETEKDKFSGDISLKGIRNTPAEVKAIADRRKLMNERTAAIVQAEYEAAYKKNAAREGKEPITGQPAYNPNMRSYADWKAGKSAAQAKADAINQANKSHRLTGLNTALFSVQQAAEDASFVGLRGAANNIAYLASQMGGPGGAIAMAGLLGYSIYELGKHYGWWGGQIDKVSDSLEHQNAVMSGMLEMQLKLRQGIEGGLAKIGPAGDEFLTGQEERVQKQKTEALYRMLTDAGSRERVQSALAKRIREKGGEGFEEVIPGDDNRAKQRAELSAAERSRDKIKNMERLIAEAEAAGERHAKETEEQEARARSRTGSRPGRTLNTAKTLADKKAAEDALFNAIRSSPEVSGRLTGPNWLKQLKGETGEFLDTNALKQELDKVHAEATKGINERKEALLESDRILRLEKNANDAANAILVDAAKNKKTALKVFNEIGDKFGDDINKHGIVVAFHEQHKDLTKLANEIASDDPLDKITRSHAAAMARYQKEWDDAAKSNKPLEAMKKLEGQAVEEVKKFLAAKKTIEDLRANAPSLKVRAGLGSGDEDPRGRIAAERDEAMRKLDISHHAIIKNLVAETDESKKQLAAIEKQAVAVERLYDAKLRVLDATKQHVHAMESEIHKQEEIQRRSAKERLESGRQFQSRGFDLYRSQGRNFMQQRGMPEWAIQQFEANSLQYQGRMVYKQAESAFKAKKFDQSRDYLKQLQDLQFQMGGMNNPALASRGFAGAQYTQRLIDKTFEHEGKDAGENINRLQAAKTELEGLGQTVLNIKALGPIQLLNDGTLGQLNEAINRMAVLREQLKGIGTAEGVAPNLPDAVAPIKRASGGLIPGTDTGRDDVPAMLRRNEYVFRPAAVKVFGKDRLDRWNRNPHIAKREISILENNREAAARAKFEWSNETAHGAVINKRGPSASAWAREQVASQREAESRYRAAEVKARDQQQKLAGMPRYDLLGGRLVGYRRDMDPDLNRGLKYDRNPRPRGKAGPALPPGWVDPRGMSNAVMGGGPFGWKPSPSGGEMLANQMPRVELGFWQRNPETNWLNADQHVRTGWGNSNATAGTAMQRDRAQAMYEAFGMTQRQQMLAERRKQYLEMMKARRSGRGRSLGDDESPWQMNAFRQSYNRPRINPWLMRAFAQQPMMGYGNIGMGYGSVMGAFGMPRMGYFAQGGLVTAQSSASSPVSNITNNSQTKMGTVIINVGRPDQAKDSLHAISGSRHIQGLRGGI